jgi:hypothetical protein
MPKRNSLESIQSNFIEKDGCHIWQGGLCDSGFPQSSYQNESIRVHRFLYTLKNGDLPKKAVLKHTCKNKLCVNPDHLMIKGSYIHKGEKIGKQLPMEEIHERLKVFRLFEVCRQLKLDYQLVYRTLRKTPPTCVEKLYIRVPVHEEE